MPKAIDINGQIAKLDKCYIIAGGVTIYMQVLPDISDSKGATYSSEPAQGRSSSVTAYNYSDPRLINWTVHFVATDKETLRRNVGHLRILKSCLYPKTKSGNTPYSPPPICKLKCGIMLDDSDLCAILRNCSVRLPRDVPWDETDYIPYKFDAELSFEVVYNTSELPGHEKLFDAGKGLI